VGEVDEAAWRRLADRAIEPNPYLDPRFVVPFQKWNKVAEQMYVALVEDEDELAALLLVDARPRRMSRSFPAAVISTAGPAWVHHLDRLYPLVYPERPAEAIAALILGLREHFAGALLELTTFPGDAALADAFTLATARLGLRTIETDRSAVPFSRRPPERHAAENSDPIAGQFALGHLSGDRRGKLLRPVRAYGRQTGSVLKVVDRSADPTLADRFVRLQASGWKGDVNRGGAAVSVNPDHEAWFRTVTAAFQRDGDLWAVALQLDEEIVAINLVLASGSGAIGLLDTYDERFAKLSLGTLGRLAVIRRVFERPDLLQFDPGFGGHYGQSARDFPDRREFVTLVLPVGDMRSRLIVAAARMFLRIKSLPISARIGNLLARRA